MIQKIKMLAKKAWSSVKKWIGSALRWIKSAEKPRMYIQKLCGFVSKLWDGLRQLAQKLWQFIMSLWQSSENRILLILIGAVLALLILALVLFFGIDWSNTVGICYRGDTNAANAAYRQVLERSLAQRGFEVIITDANDDQSEQLAQIDDLVKRNCKALIVEPVTESAGQELLDALDEASVAAVLLDSMPEEAADHKRIAFVDADPAMAGEIQAQMVMDLPNGGDINGDGTVSFIVLQDSLQYSDGIRMAERFQAYLTENSVAYAQLSAGEGETAVPVWTQCMDALTTYGKDIEVVLCAGDLLTASAAGDIKEFGLHVGKDIYLFGVGTDDALLQLVNEGSVSGTVDADLTNQVQAVIDGIVALLGAQSSVPSYQAQYTAVTAGEE